MFVYKNNGNSRHNDRSEQTNKIQNWKVSKIQNLSALTNKSAAFDTKF